jgi:sarcosine oxidase, subunit gamma
MPEVSIACVPGPRLATVRLRVALAAAARAAAQLDLPTAPATAAFGDTDRLWIAPDQWLLTSEVHAAADLLRECERALGALRHHVVDASAALERLFVSGPRARALLAMGSGVDFEPRRFPVGTCARTRFARIAVIVVGREPDRFELIVDRSYHAYLQRWLVRAASDPLLAA